MGENHNIAKLTIYPWSCFLYHFMPLISFTVWHRNKTVIIMQADLSRMVYISPVISNPSPTMFPNLGRKTQPTGPRQTKGPKMQLCKVICRCWTTPGTLCACTARSPAPRREIGPRPGIHAFARKNATMTSWSAPVKVTWGRRFSKPSTACANSAV